MPAAAEALSAFYASSLGDVARRLVGRIIRARWPDAAGLTVAALGYGAPYLDRYREIAVRCVALMPAEQGAEVWPEGRRCAAALVESEMLPLPDASVDRLLIVHALETAARPGALLQEAWRVVAPEGRILVIVPSRRGVWARADGTPFGQGSPYSKTQLRELLQGAVFLPVYWGEALFAPPIDRRCVVRSAATFERFGATVGFPFAGVLVVEAVKQVARPVGVHAIARARRAAVNPALAASARREAAASPHPRAAI